MPTIGELEPVPLQELYPHEAGHLTPWIAANIGKLGRVIGVPLTVVRCETRVGAFFADIVAIDKQQNRVIIENQLYKSDHSHLGQLLTYVANLDARGAVWITPAPRPEHTQAIRWLNARTAPDIAFYLVKVEAARIGRSAAAPLFTLVAGPADEAARVEMGAVRRPARWWRRRSPAGPTSESD